MPFAEVGDVRLFYTDAGAGDPPLLFVHGFTCDSHDWSWQLPHFANRRVIAADLRGHGRSSVPDGGFDVRTFADDLAGLLDQIGCGPVVAIGHSMGGVIVSALAVEHAALVRAVVTVDPAYLFPAARVAALEPLLDALAGPDPVSVVQGVLARKSPGLPAALTMWHKRRIAGMPQHILRQVYPDLIRKWAPESVSAPYLAQRSCPVLSMHANPARAAVEKGLLTDTRSRVVTFEGSGHWLHQERPNEVNYLLDTWLALLAKSE